MANDIFSRPGDSDNNLLRKILDRLNAGVTLFGVSGELPIDVPIVAVANFPLVQNVTVTNFPGVQEVIGTVLVSNFPAGFNVNNFPAGFAVNNFPAVQPVSGTVNVGNFPATVDTHLADPQTNTHVWVDHFHKILTSDMVRLAGASFSGAIDTNFWTVANTGSGGTTAAAGFASLVTGDTANSTTKLTSSAIGRHIANTVNVFRCVVRCVSAGVTNLNRRRWGAYTANNGFFFEQNSNTLRGVVRSGGADNVVTLTGVGSAMQDGNFHEFEIRYSVYRADFYVDSIYVASASLIESEDVLTQAQDYPVVFENINSNGYAVNEVLQVAFGIISRNGEIRTACKYANIATNTTTVLKTTAGWLYKVIVGGPAGTVTIYDNTSAAAPIIGVLTLNAGQPPNHIEFDVPFNTGLTIVTSSASVNITVVYE